ncbi:MAG: EF-hand domain-containing protein [Nitrospiraceae bacterium]|nr:MAG: EF-hand domain-containing protein [Nitrospiraceae bacterium]
MIIIKFTVVIAAVTISLLVLAGPAGANHPLFDEVDTNKDGRIDREELASYMKKNAFDELDSDRNEGLTAAEWEGAHYLIDEEQHRNIFRSLDRDRDERISYPEFQNYIEKYSNIEDAFMVMDKDKDGALAPDEITYIPAFRLITIHY